MAFGRKKTRRANGVSCVKALCQRRRSTASSKVKHAKKQVVEEKSTRIATMMELVNILKKSPETLYDKDEELSRKAVTCLKEYADELMQRYSDLDMLYINDLTARQIYQQIRLMTIAIQKKYARELKKVSFETRVDSKTALDVQEMIETEFSDDKKQSNQSDGDLSKEYSQELLKEPSMEYTSESEVEHNKESLESIEDTEESIESIHDASEQCKDLYGLNDGFFDIDQFNRQTLEMEQRETSEFDMQDIDDNISSGEDEIFYQDFFGSKSKQPSKKILSAIDSPTKKGLGIEKLNDNIKKDLFEMEQPSKLSRTEQRRIALEEQISQLERENVSQKEWMMLGEASVKDRKANSLFDSEGDKLEFEQNKRPAPVISEETTNALESLIKQRIVDKNFDDVPAKLLEQPPEIQTSKVPVLNDTKSKIGLAQLYENEFLEKVDPEGHLSEQKKDLNQAQLSIQTLWNSVESSLNSLASWYYKPKTPKEVKITVQDISTIQMEEAQPSADVGYKSQLAPQDIYKPGSEKHKDKEYTAKGGITVSNVEMTKEQRRAARRRYKRQLKKMLDEKKRKIEFKVSADPNMTRRIEKKNMINDLARAGVKIIGKKTNTRHIKNTQKTGLSFKL